MSSDYIARLLLPLFFFRSILPLVKWASWRKSRVIYTITIYHIVSNCCRYIYINKEEKGRENKSRRLLLLLFEPKLNDLRWWRRRSRRRRRRRRKRAISINRCVWLGVVGGWERRRRRRSHLNIMAGVWVARERLANAMARKSLPLFPFFFFVFLSFLYSSSFFVFFLLLYLYLFVG